MTLSGRAQVAGVVGAPVGQSLSPLIHNAWLAAAGVDGVYVPFALAVGDFERFVAGVRSGPLRGLNVTLPFKSRALALADEADEPAVGAGSANLLLFGSDGAILARNTDGVGLVAALAEQAPALRLDQAPAVVVGAGGAGQGAVMALLAAGAPQVRILNRTSDRAQALATRFGVRAQAYGLKQAPVAFADAGLIVNATSAGMNGHDPLGLPLECAPATAVVMDMVYRPLRTDLLRRAEALGLQVVDGLAMLIGQARPSFEAIFGLPPPPDTNVRGLALLALRENR